VVWQVSGELTEAEVASQQPAVRGQLVGRLTRYLNWCEEQMGGDEDNGADPRFAELAVRITDRLAKLYRLERAPQVVAEEINVVSDAARTRAIVSAQLRDLASRGVGVIEEHPRAPLA